MPDSTFKVYQVIEPTSVGGIISNAWRTLRTNFKIIIPQFFFPVLILSILLGFIKKEETPIAVTFFENFFDAPEIYIVIIFVTTFLSFRYSKLFFNLITNQPTKASYFRHFVRINIANIIKISILIVFEVALFIILNLFAIFSITIIFASLAMLLDKNSELIGIYASFFFGLLLTLILVFSFFLALSIEFIFFFLQLTAVSIEEIPVRFSILRALEIMTRDFVKYIKFSVICMFLFIFLYINFHMVFFFIFIIITAIIESVMSLDQYSKHLESFSDIASFCITISILWPFFISTVINYYYDFKIRKEGYDLEMHIKNEQNPAA